MVNLHQLNRLSPEEFTRLLGPVFEHSPWIAARTERRRPFADRDEVYRALCRTVAGASEEEKLSLLRAHPDLVGNATLTTESRSEQAAAGLGELSAAEMGQFRKFNEQYRAKIGFPFIICARLNKKDAILTAFPARLQNSREEEMETALRETFKIADLRLKDLLQ